MPRHASQMIPLDGLTSMLWPLLGLSLMSNLAVLVSPLFMMQVFNRVVPTGNYYTLILLLVVAVVVLVGVAIAETLRDRAEAEAGLWLEHRVQTALNARRDAPFPGCRQDGATARPFLIGGTINAALSLLWLPVFVCVLISLHVGLAIGTLFAGCALLAMAELSRRMTMRPSGDAARLREMSNEAASQIMAQPLLAAMMRIGANLLERRADLMAQASASERAALHLRAGFNATSGLLRSLSQIGLLTGGAFILMQGQITAGGMVAATLIGAKVLATIEGGARAIPDARAFLAALKRIRAYSAEDSVLQTDIAGLTGAITADTLIMPRGPGAPPRLDRVSLSLAAGECLAILGESGSGKTTLLHALCGAEHAPIGAVRYDQSDIRTLPPERLQQIVGYLPQGATLLPGTLAANISRWDLVRNDEAIVAAARMAGVHGLISALPRAYETELPADAHLLSPGQKQRIALARALYSKPRLLFLDEPNALLDTTAERFVFEALRRLKADGCTIVMSMHRGGIISLADKVLVMDRGKVSDFGPRRAVLERMDGGQRQVRLPVSLGAEDDLADWISTQFRRDEDGDLRQKSIKAGRELFNFARANGPITANRLLTVQFRFVDDLNCIIILSEPRRTQLQAKIDGVRNRLRNASKPPTDLAADELALVEVLQLAEAFDFSSADKNSTFTASLRTNFVPAPAMH